MVLRQMGKGECSSFRTPLSNTAFQTDPAEQEAYVKESITKAKEALAMDVKDGKSWSELEGYL